MSRRKKPSPEPKSANWREYHPSDGLYWRLGGRLTPPDLIHPHAWDASQTYSTQRPEYRARLVVEALAEAEKDLADQTAYYLMLEAEGIEAMKFAWYREEDRKLDAEPGNWAMVARNVDRHKASCYRQIGLRKGQIAAYRDLLAQIESEALPLLFVGGKNRTV